MTIKAIETRYKGYRFRSRLEARWAVFFDALGLKYRYEDQGYDLDGLWYLPDFLFPDDKAVIEIKPQNALRNDVEKTERLANELTDHWVIAICGNPWPWEYGALYPGNLFVGGIGNCAVKPTKDKMLPFPTSQFAACQYGCCVALVVSSIDGEKCSECKYFRRDYDCDSLLFWKRPNDQPIQGSRLLIDKAYIAARSARFEHGECP